MNCQKLHLTDMQESMAEEIDTSRAALRPWARRAEKQAARGRSPSPRRSMSRRTPSADLGGTPRHISSNSSTDLGSISRQFSTGSAAGSGERSIQSYLARSSRDGDVPELISQVNSQSFHVMITALLVCMHKHHSMAGSSCGSHMLSHMLNATFPCQGGV